jgi:Tfp pilus assembly protein PilV
MDRHPVANDGGGPGRSHERGNTLVEVIVGGVIIALCVFALFQIIGQGSLMNQTQLLRRQAYQQLVSVLEMPKFSSVSPYYLSLAKGDPDTTMTVALSSTINATVSVNVDSVSYFYNSVNIPAKKLTAIISYSYSGTAYLDTLQTLITNSGIN